MYTCADISYYPPPLLPLSLCTASQIWSPAGFRAIDFLEHHGPNFVAVLLICVFADLFRLVGTDQRPLGVAQRSDRLLVAMNACLSGVPFAYLGVAVLLSLFGMSFYLELSFCLEFAWFWLEMSFLLLANLYFGLLHVSVFFLSQIICHLVLACDSLDSLYLYLFPRLLDFNAFPSCEETQTCSKPVSGCH